jgi:hypothetical protein
MKKPDKIVRAKDGTEVGESIKARPIPEACVARLEIHIDTNAVIRSVLDEILMEEFKEKYGRDPNPEELKILLEARKPALPPTPDGNAEKK